jgi:hypothetical protein
VELNNQAKHSVANNMDKHRVHLIFDYVDEYPIKQRYLLSPGEVVHQTRRSIDLAREMASVESRRKAPTFIIIGAQVCKCCGDTARAEETPATSDFCLYGRYNYTLAYSNLPPHTQTEMRHDVYVRVPVPAPARGEGQAPGDPLLRLALQPRPACR